MRLLWKILLPVLILGVGAGLTTWLIISKQEPARKPIVITPPTVSVVVAEPKRQPIDVTTHGTVQPRAMSALGAEVPGRIVYVRPELAVGVLVNAGEELLLIDDADFKAAVAESNALLAQRRRELAEEEAESARAAREWAALGKGEPTDLVLRKPQLEAARARITAAEAAVKKAENDLARTVVRAPYRARIERKVVDLGSRVQPGGELLTLAAADAYEVVLPITLDEVRFLDLPLGGNVVDDGPAVAVSARIGNKLVTWPGHIIRTTPQLDQQTRMIHAVARIEQSTDTSVPPIMPGLFVDAVITGIPVDNVISVPLATLQADDVVYAFEPGADDNGTVKRTDAIVLARTATTALLHGTISPGTLLITGKVPGITDGLPVRRDRVTAPDTKPEQATP